MTISKEEAIKQALEVDRLTLEYICALEKLSIASSPDKECPNCKHPMSIKTIFIDTKLAIIPQHDPKSRMVVEAVYWCDNCNKLGEFKVIINKINPLYNNPNFKR